MSANDKVNDIELMAPAGDLASGYAALQFGADAIYLGLRRFSARAEATNFSLSELEKIVGYAHGLQPKRKVYLALNTLVLDSELKEVVQAIADALDIGVDAIILQDLGIWSLLRKNFPQARLHASTQMAIHNLEGARALQDLGFRRVTLARELTLAEIREISAGIRIETEFFAHGALCYSYSGLCLMSSLLLGRSGNRGRCAYLCRDRYRVVGCADEGFFFSMKDLCAADHLEELKNSGIASLKIEGRMKSPLYVAATVKFYRGLLSGKLPTMERQKMEDDIKTIFSRAWTDLYLRSRANRSVIDPIFVGHRGAVVGKVEAVIAGEGAYWLVFTPNRSLQRFDGLQLDVGQFEKPFGFSIEEMYLYSSRSRQGRPCFRVEAGSKIRVRLPPHHPPIPLGSPVYCAASQEVKKRYEFKMPRAVECALRRPIRVRVYVRREGIEAHAVYGSVCVTHNVSANLAPAKDTARCDEAIRNAFARTGGTAFQVADLEIVNPNRLFAPVSLLNQVRRELLERLQAALNAEKEQYVMRIVTDIDQLRKSPPTGDEELLWSVKVSDEELLDVFLGSDSTNQCEVVFDLRKISVDRFDRLLGRFRQSGNGERVRWALPLIMRSWERDLISKKVLLALGKGFVRWEIGGLGAWHLLRSLSKSDVNLPDPLDISADWSFYILNRLAAQQLGDWNFSQYVLSPEDTLVNVRDVAQFASDRMVALLYQDSPLFISENCVLPWAIGKGQCPAAESCSESEFEMTSSHGDKVEVLTERCRTYVFHERPLCWAGAQADLVQAGVRRFRVDLSWRRYPPETARQIWDQIRKGQPWSESHVGNLYRGLM